MAVAVAVQRPLRGSRVSSFYPVKILPSLSSLDSAFQLQEYISLLIRLDVHDVDSIVSLPGKVAFKDEEKSSDLSDQAERKSDDPERKSDVAVDRGCWIYEQLRRLAQDLSHPLITMLQQECTRITCPEMKAGEWLYLCVAHGNDGAMEQCCAIDYILHTLDSATALLNSPRAFPSRLSIPATSYRHFSSLARRLGRIFAHAYFHHREAFEQAEAESSLYARFLKLTNQFDLVPAEFLVIPPSAVLPGRKGRDEDVEPPRLLAAAVNPPRELEDQNAPTAEQSQLPNVREKSPSGLSTDNPIGNNSPRRLGRNRTDTMVFSEGYNVAEELAKGGDHGVAESSTLLRTALSAEPESYSQASWSNQPTEFPPDEFGFDVEEVPVEEVGTVTGIKLSTSGRSVLNVA
ncbi:Mob1/phocein [Suillus spraguei]|nr:Mob1/phocein [Suillus spraguei]